MNNTPTREALVDQAHDAAIQMMIAVNDLLDAAEFYFQRYPVISGSDALKTEQLEVGVTALGQLAHQLAEQVKWWKNENEPIVSKLGIELEIVNELYVTIEATLLFFVRENIDLPKIDMSAVKRAHSDLIRCTRLL